MCGKGGYPLDVQTCSSDFQYARLSLLFQTARSTGSKPAAQIYVHPRARAGENQSAAGQKASGEVSESKSVGGAGGGVSRGSERPHPPQQQHGPSSSKEKDQPSSSQQQLSSKVATKPKRVTEFGRAKSRSNKSSSSEQKKKPTPPSRKAPSHSGKAPPPTRKE